jgi:hypothetical protein
MHSTKKMMAFGLMTTLTLIGMAIAAAAPASEFGGSRADVRTFCTGEGAFLMEGGNFTLCITPATDVVCRDDNVCSSSNLEMALAEGFQRLDVAVL